MALIEAKNLSVGYDGHAILSGVSFTVNSGDYLAIIGHNGSGKSTLMRTILSLQPAVSGEIIFSDGLSAKQIGYLPQQTQVQRDFPATVREIVLSGCQGGCGARPFYNRGEKKRAEDAMARMGILKMQKKCYRELSGGQQQRVLLARATMAAGRILLLDEPVTGLDPDATGQLYDLIAGLNADGMTIMMISHDHAAALSYATHILSVGEEFFFGTKDEWEARKDD